MKKIYLSVLACMFSFLSVQQLYAQIPELMYFRFNSASGSSVANEAQTSTKVSTSGTLTTLGLTTGGQFGSALAGNGGVSSTNNFSAGWSTNLSGAWTLSLWISGLNNSLVNNYVFGDAGCAFRAFTGSGLVSGAGNLLVRASGMTDVLFSNVFNSTGSPVVIHIVYDPTTPAIRGYVNGVLHTTIAQTSTMALSGSGFLIGGYGSNNCIPSGGLVDEFRLYNRALTATEISNTWNIDLLASACAAPTGLVASGVTNTTASLSWGAASGSIGYEYAVSTSGTPPASGTLITPNSYAASGLTPNTSYYIHVRNKCSTTSFSSWVSTSFTTQNFVSCFPPAAASIIPTSTSTAILSWSPVPGSQGYEYVINQSAGNPAGNGTVNATTSVPLAGLTGGASYYAHIRNVCAAADKSVWLHQAFTMPVCNTPSNLLVSNITDSTTDLLWSQMPNASAYNYAVTFSKQPPTFGYQTTTNIAAHLSSLQPNSKYYVHVRSRCFSNDTSAWRTDSFVTQMGCYGPIVQVNGLGSNTPYAFWDPIPMAVGYEYALTPTNKPSAFGTNIYTAFVGLSLPEDGKDYYLHVRTKCNSMFTFSQWTTVALRTGTTDVLDPTKHADLELYPNPATDRLYIKGSSAGEPYTIIDITGRAISNGKTAQGTSEINIAGMTPGIYVLKLHEVGQVLKFIKE